MSVWCCVLVWCVWMWCVVCMCAHVVFVWVYLCMEMDTTSVPVPKEARGSHIIGVQVDLQNGFAVVERHKGRCSHTHNSAITIKGKGNNHCLSTSRVCGKTYCG